MDEELKDFLVGIETSDSETKLLTEFWKWGRTTDQKLRRTEHTDSMSVARISVLEDRVFTLERKAGSPE